MSQAADAQRRCIVDIVTALRSALPEVVAVYRFGTWGTDAERIDSDVDIAVLARMPLPIAQVWELAQQLATIAGRDVDLVDLRAASTVMAAQVVSQGDRLYCSDVRQCVEYENYIYSAYAHLNEERCDILRDIQNRGSIYG